MKAMVRSAIGDIDIFNIIAGVLKGDRIEPYRYIIYRDYIIWTNISNKNKWFHIEKREEADDIR